MAKNKFKGVVVLSRDKYKKLDKVEDGTLYVKNQFVDTPEKVSELENDLELLNKEGIENSSLDFKNKPKVNGEDVALSKEIPQVVNNLDTDSSTKPLSAAQGKALNQKITNIMETVNGKNNAFTIKTLLELGMLFAPNVDTAKVEDSFKVPSNVITYNEKEYVLKNGDVFYIVDTNVPDYWFSKDDYKLYKMETTKVDLSQYALITKVDEKNAEQDQLIAEKANSSDLSKVATSNNYNDLDNLPELFSGDYEDLTNKPDTPVVNNGTLTIQKNGVDLGTFSANQSSNSTINITTAEESGGDFVVEDKLSGIDLNTLVDAGNYGISSDCINIPSNKSGTLFVGNYENGQYAQQLFIDSSNVTWVRSSTSINNSNWKAWSKLANSDDIKDFANIDFVNQMVNNKAKTIPWNIKTTMPQIDSYWETITWNGLTNFSTQYIWSDGENIYYSYNTTQYKLQKETRTWEPMTWNGLTNFSGRYIWAHGKYIYYSEGSIQYVLNKDTYTWEQHTWSGLTNFYGYNVWTDGKTMYYSNGTSQYQLSWNSASWTSKTWTGLTSFFGDCIWADGNYIYYSYGAKHYYIDPYNGIWMPKTWNGISNVTSFAGYNIWTDGENIYYSSMSNQYVLQKGTNNWQVFNQKNGLTNISGNKIWTDGSNVYYSNTYILRDAITPKTTLTVKSVKSVNGKTGDITGLATEEYVQENGSKIDVIKVNDVLQTITNKEVNIDVVESENYLESTGVGTPLDNYYTKVEILDVLYPVGTIYLTTSTNGVGSSSPASWLGGTWERLPEGYALWTASSGAGGTISAGLPNITGSFGGNQDQGATGAFYKSKSGVKNSGMSSYACVVQLDASRSSSIYGASTTVQPPAYKVYAWRRVS